VSDKTEEATPKRLKKAQEEGNSPLSTFASQSVAFLCAVAIAPAAAAALADDASGGLRAAIGEAAKASPSAHVDATVLATSVIALSAPVLAVAALTGAVTSLVQTGGVIATKKLAPDLAKLNPIEGFKNLFSSQRLLTVVRAAALGLAVAWFAYDALKEHAVHIAHTAGRLDAAVLVAKTVAVDVAKRAAIAGLFLAVIDVVVTRTSWRKRLRMSKDEVKREHKESEGDPEQKAARERAHHEMLASATVGNVKNASVVVVNPTHIACALRYDAAGEGDEAPVVLATGHGDLARRIVEAAHAYGVPVLRDVPLARALVELEVGDEIPEALYEAVAEILREAWDERPASEHGGT
jgi:flagellar biosynthesis protein FlhB